MSAITGILHFHNDPVPIEQGNGLMYALKKFPADDIQTWHREEIFLGCHAQWITPESIHEQLPYYDSIRQFAITADAIIDNRDELFHRLQVSYDKRKQITDSELILLSYEKWGEDSPKYLVGDFAFMIWDEKKKKLFGARDFSGNRTLYYYRDFKRFVFCTAIKPLFTLPYIEKRLNEQWLAQFLAIPTTLDAIDAASSVYYLIEQIPPSHSISVTKSGIKFSRYCTFSMEERLKLKSNEEYEEAFREVFQSAVKSRLRTYRNVGAHLSGGLDSGSVVSFAARALRKEEKSLHTFSYIPIEDFIDWTPRSRVANERPFIEETVQYVGNIKDYYMDFQEMSPLSEVDDYLELLEMPYKFFENSFWLKGIYEKANDEGIGILLNGGRGNYTVSFGSALDYYAILFRRLRWIRLYDELHQFSEKKGVGRKRLLSLAGKRAFPFLNKMFRPRNPYHFPILINPEFAKNTNVFQKLKQHGMDVTDSSIPNFYEARKKQFDEVVSWQISGTNSAKLSLRYGLWNRDPTNDLRVIRFCLSVPDEQFVQNGLDRALIRRATKTFLPDTVRLNQRTRGVQGADGVHRMFSHWPSFLEEVNQLGKDKVMSGFLNMDVINKAIAKFQEGPRPEYVFDAEFKVLMRSLIVYRFLKKHV